MPRAIPVRRSAKASELWTRSLRRFGSTFWFDVFLFRKNIDIFKKNVSCLVCFPEDFWDFHHYIAVAGHLKRG